MNYLSAATGFVVGMLAMYYFDEEQGRQRRAMLRDRAWSGSMRMAHRGEQQARHAAGRARGVLATGNLQGRTRRPPENDHQLHDRVRSAMGRVVSHPGAIEVEVEHGCVTLRGDVLRSEVDGLLRVVRDVPGVERLDNRQAGHISSLQGTGR